MTQCIFQTKLSKFYFILLKNRHFDQMNIKCLPFSTKTVIKWPKIDLQTSVRPIWNPENQGYKIGKSYQEQQLRPKNGSEKSVRLLSANTV